MPSRQLPALSPEGIVEWFVPDATETLVGVANPCGITFVSGNEKIRTVLHEDSVDHGGGLCSPAATSRQLRPALAPWRLFRDGLGDGKGDNVEYACERSTDGRPSWPDILGCEKSSTAEPSASPRAGGFSSAPVGRLYLIETELHYALRWGHRWEVVPQPRPCECCSALAPPLPLMLSTDDGEMTRRRRRVRDFEPGDTVRLARA